jgi:hypothetical protein
MRGGGARPPPPPDRLLSGVALSSNALAPRAKASVSFPLSRPLARAGRWAAAATMAFPRDEPNPNLLLLYIRP